MKVDDFIKEYCSKKCCLYKSPSCNPKDINYRSDCEFWKEIRKEELKKEFEFSRNLSTTYPNFMDMIKEVRSLTHCGVIQARDALIRALGDIEEAVRLIKSGELLPPDPWK